MTASSLNLLSKVYISGQEKAEVDVRTRLAKLEGAYRTVPVTGGRWVSCGKGGYLYRHRATIRVKVYSQDINCHSRCHAVDHGEGMYGNDPLPGQFFAFQPTRVRELWQGLVGSDDESVCQTWGSL